MLPWRVSTGPLAHKNATSQRAEVSGRAVLGISHENQEQKGLAVRTTWQMPLLGYLGFLTFWGLARRLQPRGDGEKTDAEYD